MAGYSELLLSLISETSLTSSRERSEVHTWNKKMSLLRMCIRPAQLLLHSRHSFLRHSSTRSISGAVLSKPEKTRFGLTKVTLIVVPFLYVGGIISREGAAWLEENDIFSPEDDD